MIINLLNEEFDLDKFVIEGLILSHFPLEDRNKAYKVSQFWDQEQFNCITNTIRLETDQKTLRPLHAISDYYGPVIGWYFAFIVQLIGWLAAPSIFGIALGIYILVQQEYE